MTMQINICWQSSRSKYFVSGWTYKECIYAINLDNSEAMYAMARYSEDEKNKDNFLKYLSMAVCHGNTHALNYCGIMYAIGLYFQRNIKDALKYFNMASELGDIDGTANAGNVYYLQKKYTHALKCYKIASYMKNVYATEMLIWMYVLGLGVEKNIGIVMEYYNIFIELYKTFHQCINDEKGLYALFAMVSDVPNCIKGLIIKFSNERSIKVNDIFIEIMQYTTCTFEDDQIIVSI